LCRFIWVSQLEVAIEESTLAERFLDAMPIRGTRSFHCILTANIPPGMLEVKNLSSDTSVQVRVISRKSLLHQSPAPHSLSLADVVPGTFVSFCYNGCVYPGEVLETVDEDNIRINAMEKAGPQTWKWPRQKDAIFYKLTDIQNVLTLPVLQSSRGHFSFPCIL
jgi:hypothetical protein